MVTSYHPLIAIQNFAFFILVFLDLFNPSFATTLPKYFMLVLFPVILTLLSFVQKKTGLTHDNIFRLALSRLDIIYSSWTWSYCTNTMSDTTVQNNSLKRLLLYLCTLFLDKTTNIKQFVYTILLAGHFVSETNQSCFQNAETCTFHFSIFLFWTNHLII